MRKKKYVLIIGVIILVAFITIFQFVQKDNLKEFLNSNFVNVIANSNVSYFLNDKGVLFCPSYNIDAGEFVPTEKNKVVGVNVKKLGDNFYINNNNELYVWGLSNTFKYIPGFSNKNGIYLIADDVLEAQCNHKYTAYINTNNELWAVGEINGTKYEEFTKIKNNVKKIIDINRSLAYIDLNDNLYENDKIIFENMKFKDVKIVNGQIALLTVNNELYFCGTLTDNYINNTTNEASNVLLNVNEEEPLKLKENIIKISMDSNVIGAIDEQGKAYIWGYFYNNGDDNYSTREVKDFYGYEIANNIKDISVSTYTIVMIDKNGKSFAYGVNDSLSGIGNSIDSSKEYIGLNSTETIRWQ